MHWIAVIFIICLHIYLQIIPPGMEFNNIVEHHEDLDGEQAVNEETPSQPDPPIWAEVL